jgi:glycosyltransferase involved in cell wall biosynthesis
VKDFSEVLVIDDFSTDGTVEIARRYTDRIHQVRWQGYARQKQTGIDMATLPWVLVLDADERVTDALKDEIAGAADKAECAGYCIARKNFFLGTWIRHGGWWPDYTLRFFRKDSGRMERREVHEKIVVTGRVGHLQNPMTHITYRNLTEFMNKMDRYASLSARELRDSGKTFSALPLMVKPPATFLRMYILQQGFRDGFPGFILAGLYSFYTFLKYLKLWEMEQNQGTAGNSQ